MTYLEELIARAPELPWQERSLTGPNRMLEGADKLDAVYAFGIGTHIGEKFAALELAQHCVNLMPTIATELEMTLHGGELPELAAQIIRGLLAQINSPEQVTTK